MTRAALVLALALAVAGCSGSDAPAPSVEGPDVFFKRLLDYEFTGQFGKSWEMLHPGHQALVTRSRYTNCSRDDFGPTTLTAVETIDVYDDPIDVPDVPEKTSKAVVLEFTLATGEAEESSTHTFHAVRLGDRWAWYFGEATIDAYKQGGCP